MDDLISRQAAIDAVKRLSLGETDATRLAMRIGDYLERLSSAQPELIEKAAYIRGFEQGRTQGMIDSKCGKKMNKQRKVMITITYNEMGIIIDTKAEELDSSAQTEQRWIPCSERLPDEDYCTGANRQYSADVLITVHNADDEETIIDYGHTLDGAWYSDTTDCIVPSEWEVIAWMPLPKPYKGEET